MLSSQLQNAVIELLSQFISNDFSDMEKVKESFESAWHGERKQVVESAFCLFSLAAAKATMKHKMRTCIVCVVLIIMIDVA